MKAINIINASGTVIQRLRDYHDLDTNVIRASAKRQMFIKYDGMKRRRTRSNWRKTFVVVGGLIFGIPATLLISATMQISHHEADLKKSAPDRPKVGAVYADTTSHLLPAPK